MCANDWPSLEDAISATKWPTLENCAFEMIAFLSRYHFAKCWCSDDYQTFPTLQHLRSLHFSRGSINYLASIPPVGGNANKYTKKDYNSLVTTL